MTKAIFLFNQEKQLFLYTALANIGTKEYTKARKTLNQIMMNGKSIFILPLYRTIRLVNLIVLYELNEFDYIAFEARSVKREIQNKKRMYQIEILMLKLFNKSL